MRGSNEGTNEGREVLKTEGVVRNTLAKRISYGVETSYHSLDLE